MTQRSLFAFLEVKVDEREFEYALKKFKKLSERNVLSVLKRRKYHEKPLEKRKSKSNRARKA